MAVFSGFISTISLANAILGSIVGPVSAHDPRLSPASRDTEQVHTIQCQYKARAPDGVRRPSPHGCATRRHRPPVAGRRAESRERQRARAATHAAPRSAQIEGGGKARTGKTLTCEDASVSAPAGPYTEFTCRRVRRERAATRIKRAAARIEPPRAMQPLPPLARRCRPRCRTATPVAQSCAAEPESYSIKSRTACAS